MFVYVGRVREKDKTSTTHLTMTRPRAPSTSFWGSIPSEKGRRRLAREFSSLGNVIDILIW